MVAIYNDTTKGLNTTGLLYDIHDDDGYEQYDLILTVLEFIIDDVCQYKASDNVVLPLQEGDVIGDERDRDKLYALVGLLNEVDKEVLLQYLPKDNGSYMPELCGALRLESDSGVSE